MVDLTVKQLDDLLLGSFSRLAADRQVEDEGWAAYLRTVSPEPPFYAVFSRARWRAAFAVASKIAVKKRGYQTLVLPVWTNDNEDEVGGGEWRRETLFVFEDGDFLDVPGSFEENALAIARVQRAERPKIVEAGYVAPSYPTRYRDDEYVVTAGDTPERVVGIQAVHTIAAVPKPARSVRAFSADIEAAIDLDAAMPILAGLAKDDARATYRDHGADRWRTLIETALAEQRFTDEGDEEDGEPAG